MTAKPHFEVSRPGLAQLLERRGDDWPAFVVYELLQNALDADHASSIDVEVHPVPGIARIEVVVRDDSPDGFRDLTHAYTLFAPSEKKANAELRGRFNLGEKLVIAVAREMEIVSTRGGVRFDEDGRHDLRRRRTAGSEVRVLLSLPHDRATVLVDAARSILIPSSVALTLNGEVLPHCAPVSHFTASLATVVADSEGVLRPTKRIARVEVFEPDPDLGPYLYELGIPVVPLDGDRYSYNVLQKVPVDLERCSVPPGYLRTLRVSAANALLEAIDAEQANRAWVRDALGDERASDDLVRTAIRGRFGEKVVVADPKDHESVQTAASHGYTVVRGGQLSAAEWENVRRVEAIPSSHALFPTSIVDPSLVEEYPGEETWSPGTRVIVAYSHLLAAALAEAGIFHGKVRVEVVSCPGADNRADFLEGHLRFNVGRPNLMAVLDLIVPGVTALPDEAVALVLHELAHQDGGHLDHDYHKFLTAAGAVMRRLGHLDAEALKVLDRGDGAVVADRGVGTV